MCNPETMSIYETRRTKSLFQIGKAMIASSGYRQGSTAFAGCPVFRPLAMTAQMHSKNARYSPEIIHAFLTDVRVYACNLKQGGELFDKFGSTCVPGVVLLHCVHGDLLPFFIILIKFHRSFNRL